MGEQVRCLSILSCTHSTILTKYPAIHNCKEHNTDDTGQRSQPEKVKVLGPEYLPENNKFPLHNIEHQERLSANADERAGKKNQEENSIYQFPPISERPLWLFRIHPNPLTGFVNSGNLVSEICLLCYRAAHALYFVRMVE